MNQTSIVKVYPSTYIFDITCICAIYIIPSFSHIIPIPLYYLDPMRIIIMLAICHTSGWNAYFLAVTLPLVSFITSGHPIFIKSFLIMAELGLNVCLFLFLRKKISNTFSVALISISLSKVIYYVIKSLFISVGLLKSGLVSTPIIYQVSVMVLISVYVLFQNMDIEKG